MEPTERQLEVLNAFRELTIEQGISPSIRQVGEKLGIASTNGTRTHLESLCKKGLLTRLKGRRGYAIPAAMAPTNRKVLEQTKAVAREAAKRLPPEEAVKALLVLIEDL